MTAPLTTAKLGSTRCVGCEKRFSDTPDMAVVQLAGEEWFTRRGSVSMGEHRTVTRNWHEVCLAEFERWSEESRQRAAEDHERAMRDLCEASGLDYDEVLAKAQEARA